VEPQPIPVNALFEGDLVTLLVLLLSTDTVAEAAEKVASVVVGQRVAARDAPLVLSYAGRDVAPDQTVAEAGITPLSEVFVRFAA
jgi:hypothetical protein